MNGFLAAHPEQAAFAVGSKRFESDVFDRPARGFVALQHTDENRAASAPALYRMGLRQANAVLSAVMTKPQAMVPEQASLHPVNRLPGAGVAVRVMEVPLT